MASVDYDLWLGLVNFWLIVDTEEGLTLDDAPTGTNLLTEFINGTDPRQCAAVIIGQLKAEKVAEINILT